MESIEKNMKAEWTKEAVLELIKQWEKFECLYNNKNKLYNNKRARFDALSKITEILKLEVMSTIPLTIDNVKLKMNYLRGQYSRELNKYEKSRKNETETENFYESNAYWFPKMEFLKTYVKGKRNIETPIKMDLDRLHTITLSDDSRLSPNEPPPKRKRNMTEQSASSLKSSASEEDETLENTNSALDFLAKNEDIRKDVEAFIDYIKAEMVTITNEDLMDEMKQKITSTIFEFKMKQRNLDRIYL